MATAADLSISSNPLGATTVGPKGRGGSRTVVEESEKSGVQEVSSAAVVETGGQRQTSR